MCQSQNLGVHICGKSVCGVSPKAGVEYYAVASQRFSLQCLQRFDDSAIWEFRAAAARFFMRKASSHMIHATWTTFVTQSRLEVDKNNPNGIRLN